MLTKVFVRLPIRPSTGSKTTEGIIDVLSIISIIKQGSDYFINFPMSTIETNETGYKNIVTALVLHDQVDFPLPADQLHKQEYDG